jgi:hypothetical protein
VRRCCPACSRNESIGVHPIAFREVGLPYLEEGVNRDLQSLAVRQATLRWGAFQGHHLKPPRFLERLCQRDVSTGDTATETCPQASLDEATPIVLGHKLARRGRASESIVLRCPGKFNTHEVWGHPCTEAFNHFNGSGRADFLRCDIRRLGENLKHHLSAEVHRPS